jgi:hypothetical protein
MKKFIIFYLFIQLFFIAGNELNAQSVNMMVEGDTLVIYGEGVISGNFIKNHPLYNNLIFISWPVAIREGITGIGTNAFDCGIVTSIFIPSSVTLIDDQAFSACYGLTSITVHKNNSSFSSHEGVLFSKIGSTLVAYPPGRTGSYSVPSGVSVIGSTSFFSCIGLTSIVFPPTLFNINTGAFVNCTNLTSVTFSNTYVSIGNGAFSNCNKISEILNFSSLPQNMEAAMLPSSIFPTCIVKVLPIAVDTYWAANVWSMFTNIVPLQIEINLDYIEIYLLPDGLSKLDARYTGGVANPNKVVWKSNHPQLVTVDYNGKLKALNPGTTEIIAAISGIETVCQVKVIQKGKSNYHKQMFNKE